MTSKRRTYTKEFKLEAMRLYESSDKSVAQIEQELGITRGLLDKWRARYRQREAQAFPGKGHRSELEAELHRLRRELEVTRQERDILKKALQVFSRDGPLRYAFIVGHEAEFEVKIMCRVLQVSMSGYYAWRKRKPSQRTQDDALLVGHIRRVHAASRQTYGSPRVHAALRQQSIICSRKRVARLMQLHGIRGCHRHRRCPTTTHSNHDQPVAANILARDFSASAPNQKWLGDISYIDTLEGFLYLASLEDAYSRRIVGWAMADHMDTRLVERALHMACGQRRPQPGLLHHSDRGSQYASSDYRALLATHGIIVSMSRAGNCWDNAMMESFFATLKSECATQPFATRAQARTVIFEYIEGFYNRQRLHSALGYRSPEQFEHSFVLPFP
ncbi:MAG: IS3 family transposase [Anaerolineae bacterium]|nr:IS3 family transposase [Anaerolineae bacterium]